MERLIQKEHLEAVRKATPMGRLGSVRDVADATVWLCSEASSFINGTVVVGKSKAVLPFNGLLFATERVRLEDEEAK